MSKHTLLGAMAVAMITHASSALAQRPAAPKPAAAAAASPASTPGVKPLGETLSVEAKQDYEAARVLMTDGDAAGALLRLTSAYDKSKDPRLFWNMAAAQKVLRHYVKAIDLLRRYLADGGDLLSAKDRAEAQELTRQLEPFTVRTTFNVDQDGVELFVDEERVGTSPLPSAVLLDLGARKVLAKKEGFAHYSETVPIGGAPEATIEVKLVKEVHDGRLKIIAPPGARLVLDGKDVGSGTFEGTLPSGGHTLRVTERGMDVYEREVVVKEKEARELDVRLELESEVAKPKLRVAVGCGSREPLGSNEGLTLYIDNSPAAALAVGGKKAVDPQRDREVLHYVEYGVLPGHHKVLVRLPGCWDMEHEVDVAPGVGGDLRGALHSETPVMLRGPTGSPDWGRAGIAMWLPSALSGGRVNANAEANRYVRDLKYRPGATGIMAHGGFTWRWWTILLDIGYASGRASIDQAPNDPTLTAALESPKLRWFRTAVRTGPRFSFNVIALSLGPGIGYDIVDIAVRKPLAWQPNAMSVSGWTMLDVQPLCDFTVFGAASADALLGLGNNTLGAVSLQFGAAFQPNRRCNDERRTQFGLFDDAPKEMK